MDDAEIRKIIEECCWRKDVCGVYVCNGECLPCSAVIDRGNCETLIKYFRGENENEET